MLWRFRTYVASGGRNDVQDAVDRLGGLDAARFSRAVAHLSVAPKVQWDEPHAKKLQGYGAQYEVRFKANNCSTRALGYFGPGEGEFTITLICTHKGNVYKPHNAFKTAGTRWQQIRNGTASVAPLQVDGEDFPPDD